jgi:hypothetical protein
MKLTDLFEAIGELTPGQKKYRTDIQLRDLSKIRDRIYELRNAIESSKQLKYQFSRDAALQTSLDNLIQRVERKIAMLTRAEARPSPGAGRMIDVLRTECSEFIEHMVNTNRLLYRGLRESADQFEGRSRDDRTTKDSDAKISEAFDALLRKLGFEALRSNSIYTTTNRNFASGYGRYLYIIFPKNGYKFLHTNKRDLILDSWVELLDMDAVAEFMIKLEAWGEKNSPGWEHSSLAYAIRDKQWRRAITELRGNFRWNDNELRLPESYADMDWSTMTSTQSLMQNFEPDRTNIEAAMLNGHELLINGEYWALRDDKWNSLISSTFLKPDQWEPY